MPRLLHNAAHFHAVASPVNFEIIFASHGVKKAFSLSSVPSLNARLLQRAIIPAPYNNTKSMNKKNWKKTLKQKILHENLSLGSVEKLISARRVVQLLRSWGRSQKIDEKSFVYIKIGVANRGDEQEKN